MPPRQPRSTDKPDKPDEAKAPDAPDAHDGERQHADVGTSGDSGGTAPEEAQQLAGDALEDAGREAGHPRLGDKPWSELKAEEKRQALAEHQAQPGQGPDDGEAGDDSDPDPPADEEAYPASLYLDEPGRVGSTLAVVAGALHDVEPDKKLTATQLKRRIDRFLGRKVES